MLTMGKLDNLVISFATDHICSLRRRSEKMNGIGQLLNERTNERVNFTDD